MYYNQVQYVFEISCVFKRKTQIGTSQKRLLGIERVLPKFRGRFHPNHGQLPHGAPSILYGPFRIPQALFHVFSKWDADSTLLGHMAHRKPSSWNTLLLLFFYFLSKKILNSWEKFRENTLPAGFSTASDCVAPVSRVIKSEFSFGKHRHFFANEPNVNTNYVNLQIYWVFHH